MNLVLLPQCAFQKKGREGGRRERREGRGKRREEVVYLDENREWKEEKGICCTMPLKLARATPRLALPLNPTTFPL